MYFVAAASSENDHGSMNFEFKDRVAALDPAIQRSRHPFQRRVKDPPLHIHDHLPGIDLVPASIELLGHKPELDDKIAR